MVTYKLYEENNDSVTYRYFPQGREDFGTITMNKKTADLIGFELAETDKFKRYFYHMIEQIEEFIKRGKFLTEGFVAWY